MDGSHTGTSFLILSSLSGIIHSYTQDRLMTKLFETIGDGFDNFRYALDCYNCEEYCEFWEALSLGWMQQYVTPYDDWYNPTISPERQLRLGQRPKPPSIAMYKGLTGEYVAFVEGGYTICSQPDREKADRCLEYYKSQHPTAEFWGTWEND